MSEVKPNPTQTVTSSRARVTEVATSLDMDGLMMYDKGFVVIDGVVKEM